ncbi:DNA helicase [Ranunculus cassubicifolius]
MEGKDECSDNVVAELAEIGFKHDQIMDAIEVVGPSVEVAVEYILDGSCKKENVGLSAGSNSGSLINSSRVSGKKVASSSRPLSQMRQSSIASFFQPANTSKRVKTDGSGGMAMCNDRSVEATMKSSELPVCSQHVQEIGSDWEHKVKSLLQKHFGFSTLKSFQKEALEAWLTNQDCLVLAATGSGKSLCFQIPALLTGKVVIVISPLISLMHDQCLKLAKHGVSACFLGSGQTDSTVEQKALNGMYGIIYVCPETILRLIKPLQRLAENRGIALFAIDEVHCVSKWGHDFRPDYRKLSVLRESFRACNLKLLKSDIPLMALTATATTRVRKDVLKSLGMSEDTKVVLTSFFRPNLRFQVKHSRTGSMKTYQKDFHELIEAYGTKRTIFSNAPGNDLDASDHELDYSDTSDAEEIAHGDLQNSEDDFDGNDAMGGPKLTSKEQELSVDYLEDDFDVIQSVEDFDVTCGEFCGASLAENTETFPSETFDLHGKPEERLKLLQRPLEVGPTIIYVPTRKQTLSIAKFLCTFGVKAAAYNASLPKVHLRQVHKEFHQNDLQVIVATIAFGMGIDKSNVRRIIHYGWPQSLEAYYQEAGRAGRDGKLADCVLFANLSRCPTLLPNKRSEEQSRQAYSMLSDCYKYGMNTATCRAKILVEYFGENFDYEKCLLCDVCVNGPTKMQNMKEEADIFLQVLSSYYRGDSFEKPNLRALIRGIRQQHARYTSSDRLMWQGVGRILEDQGYIREGGEKRGVLIKFPELTNLGRKFLQSGTESTFLVYPEADMILAQKKPNSYSSFADWGKGWADPEIRRQRLEFRRSNRKPRKPRAPRKRDPNTVRGRLSQKLGVKK